MHTLLTVLYLFLKTWRLPLGMSLVELRCYLLSISMVILGCQLPTVFLCRAEIIMKTILFLRLLGLV